MKRLWLAVILCLFIPSLACADIQKEAVYGTNHTLIRTEYTFKGEVPEFLKTPLIEWGLGQAKILSGAAMEDPADGVVIPDALWTCNNVKALLLVQQDGQPMLLGITWVAGQPWQVLSFGSTMLRSASVPMIGLKYYQGAMIPAFSVNYPTEKGDLYDLFVFANNELWKMIGHGNETSGTMVVISNEYAVLNDMEGEAIYTVQTVIGWSTWTQWKSFLKIAQHASGCRKRGLSSWRALQRTTG